MKQFENGSYVVYQGKVCVVDYWYADMMFLTCVDDGHPIVAFYDEYDSITEY